MDAPLHMHWPKLGLWLTLEGILLALSIIILRHPSAMEWDEAQPDCRKQPWNCHFSGGPQRLQPGPTGQAGSRQGMRVLSLAAQARRSRSALPAARTCADAGLTLLVLNVSCVVTYFILWVGGAAPCALHRIASCVWQCGVCSACRRSDVLH